MVQLKDAMMKVFRAINPAIPDANYSTAVDDVLNFEEAIANVNSISGGYQNVRLLLYSV